MSDNNILSSNNLLQDRKIFNYMGMIFKKIICGKLYTTKSNKDTTILQSRNRSIKNIKITMRKEKIFIHRKKFKKNKTVYWNKIDNNEAILVLSNIDYQKHIKRKSYISVCDNKISSYTLFNKHNLNVYTTDEMGYIGMKRLIKSEVLYCFCKK